MNVPSRVTNIAILSDSHDQVANLRAAVGYCNQAGIAMLIHCGDLISPFMLKELAAFAGESHLIYGNNIGDKNLISSRCLTQYPHITHHGIKAEFSCSNLKICGVHYPETARNIAMQGTYDIVCCGHSHKQEIVQYAETLLINPGHLLGENDQAGFTVLDCTTLTTQRIRVGESMFKNPIDVFPEQPENTFIPSTRI